ncbi:uncharacterized protein LOC102567351 isoform X4 [Alligator mississippiensis]|uniref:uncharacterized protein LOC102567351 isoform X4 n=1 Tax=Alligator mississippiensis TaxID=8496 RepID=UPI0028776F5C|nr:uncharacterized protein LOC102567351 isoform X4 [Alligator mississippiensis]
MSQLKFCSRRSPVICTGGCVASNQTLATNIGLDILKKGGNAVDASVAVAAALNVTEPASTGIGGDCFCLYYDANTKQVHGLNGSGRSPRALTIELLKEQGFDETNPLPLLHAHNITVPGAAAGWCDAVSLYGSKKLSMGQILQPAIELAERGFPVAEITAYHWKHDVHVLQAPGNEHGKDLLIHGQAPLHGQVFCNPFLANTFKEIARCGKKGFYEGTIAAAVVETVQRHGGVMDLEDLKSHVTDEVKPIFTNYKVWFKLLEAKKKQDSRAVRNSTISFQLPFCCFDGTAFHFDISFHFEALLHFVSLKLFHCFDAVFNVLPVGYNGEWNHENAYNFVILCLICMKIAGMVVPFEGMKPARFQGVKCKGFWETAPQSTGKQNSCHLLAAAASCHPMDRSGGSHPQMAVGLCPIPPKGAGPQICARDDGRSPAALGGQVELRGDGGAGQSTALALPTSRHQAALQPAPPAPWSSA